MDNTNEMILAPIGGQVMSQLSLGMEADAEILTLSKAILRALPLRN